MAFLTDRKRVSGLGSAKTGTHHFWSTTVTAVALMVLTPMFIFTFGSVLGAPHDEVLAYLARPFPAIVAALMLVVGFHHFRLGVQVLIEDYVQGLARKIWIIAMTCVSYGLTAIGLFALAKIAL